VHVYDIQGMTKAKRLVQICLYCLKCIKFGKLFLRKVRKIVATRCLDFSSKCVWRPGSARTRWGRLSAPPDSLAAKRGPTSKGGGKGGREGRERGKEGEGGGRAPPLQPVTTLTTEWGPIIVRKIMWRSECWKDQNPWRQAVLEWIYRLLERGNVWCRLMNITADKGSLRTMRGAIVNNQVVDFRFAGRSAYRNYSGFRKTHFE